MAKICQKIKIKTALILLGVVIFGSIFFHLPSSLSFNLETGPARGIISQVLVAPTAKADNGTNDTAKKQLTPIEEKLIEILGHIANTFIRILGWVLLQLTRVLFGLMVYNDFVESDAVELGWTLIRDVANLFFVLILLAVAIATILKVESYNFKRFLPKILIMAVLVNFSKLICGLLIDFAQVIMMTFAAAYAGIGGVGGWTLMQALRVPEMLTAVAEATRGGWSVKEKALELLGVLMAAYLAVGLMIIAVVTVLVMVVVILMRMIMIWILVVLSPLAFILSAFPQGQRYAQQWWQEFAKYVIIGPILAFFLWLTFAMVGDQGITIKQAEELEITRETVGQEMEPGFFTAIGELSNFVSFVIAIGMLMGSLVITQQIGVQGGQLAGQALSLIRQKGLQAPIKAAGWLERKIYSGELPVIGRYTRGLSLSPARWYQQFTGYLERRKGEQERLGVTGAGFQYAQSMGQERKGLKHLWGLRGVVARPLNAGRMLLGSPADFMKYYGGLRGIPQFIRTLTGRERVTFGLVPGVRTPKESRLMKKLRAERKALRETETLPEREKKLEDIKKTQGELWAERKKRVTVPSPYYAVEEQRALIKEELSKLPDVMETTDVEAQMQIAYRDKDLARFQALMQKGAKDFNDNEWLNRYGYTAAAYGGRFWEDLRGKGVEEGGIQRFADEVLVKHFGLPDQQAKSFMNEVAYINEERKHGGTARLMEVDEQGVFQWRDRIEQGAYFMNEFFKGNIRGQLQNSNRLMYGGEDSKGKYHMGMNAMMVMAGASADIAHFLARKEFNKSTQTKFREDKESMTMAKRLENFIDPETEQRLMAPGLVDLIYHQDQATQEISGFFQPVVEGEVEALKRYGEIIWKVGKDLDAGMTEEEVAKKYNLKHAPVTDADKPQNWGQDKINSMKYKAATPKSVEQEAAAAARLGISDETRGLVNDWLEATRQGQAGKADEISVKLKGQKPLDIAGAINAEIGNMAKTVGDKIKTSGISAAEAIPEEMAREFGALAAAMNRLASNMGGIGHLPDDIRDDFDALTKGFEQATQSGMTAEQAGMMPGKGELLDPNSFPSKITEFANKITIELKKLLGEAREDQARGETKGGGPKKEG
jgi:hypothetical protein